MNTTTDRARRFTAVYDATYGDVLRFVQRRTPEGAEDVVAEAMTVAWRRVDELPPDVEAARAWIFGIARNCLLNHHRSCRRQAALAVHLGSSRREYAEDSAATAVPRADLERAWRRLTPEEQEAIALTVLDGLDSEHAGRVLDVSAVAYRHRLSRARANLRRHLDGADAAHTSAPLFAPQEAR